jgi:hypothetical protein
MDALAKSTKSGAADLQQAEIIAQTIGSLVGDPDANDANSDVGIELATKTTEAMKVRIKKH